MSFKETLTNCRSCVTVSKMLFISVGQTLLCFHCDLSASPESIRCRVKCAERVTVKSTTIFTIESVVIANQDSHDNPVPWPSY